MVIDHSWFFLAICAIFATEAKDDALLLLLSIFGCCAKWCMHLSFAQTTTEKKHRTSTMALFLHGARIYMRVTPK